MQKLQKSKECAHATPSLNAHFATCMPTSRNVRLNARFIAQVTLKYIVHVTYVTYVRGYYNRWMHFEIWLTVKTKEG